MQRAERTEIRWTYTPIHYFEGLCHFVTEDGDLSIANGVATLTLKQLNLNPDRSFLDQAKNRIQILFNSRRIIVHRSYRFSEPTVYQFRADGSVQKQAFRTSVGYTRRLVGRSDVVLHNGDGDVLLDTKAKRSKQQQRFVELVEKHGTSDSLLPKLLESYGAAVEDPANELVHLYEIRDALAKHFGSESTVQSRLGITRSNWRRIGQLANSEPITQGRHRGQMDNLRKATSEELDEVRDISQAFIEAYIEYLERGSK